MKKIIVMALMAIAMVTSAISPSFGMTKEPKLLYAVGTTKSGHHLVVKYSSEKNEYNVTVTKQMPTGIPKEDGKELWATYQVKYSIDQEITRKNFEEALGYEDIEFRF